jgi:hypothetical protein
MRRLSAGARNVLLVVITLGLLAGCAQTPQRPTELQQRLLDSGSWKVHAHWVWSTDGEVTVVMRGVGKWSDGGKQFRWKEEYLGTSVVTWTEGDQLRLEDGTSFPLRSEQARKRIEGDLFHALDPLELAERHGIVFRVVDDKLTGSAPCVDRSGPCTFNIDVTVDTQMRPMTAHTTMDFGSTDEQVMWSYFPKD